MLHFGQVLQPFFFLNKEQPEKTESKRNIPTSKIKLLIFKTFIYQLNW